MYTAELVDLMTSAGTGSMNCHTPRTSAVESHQQGAEEERPLLLVPSCGSPSKVKIKKKLCKFYSVVEK